MLIFLTLFNFRVYQSTVVEIPKLLVSISRRYNQIMKIKIRGQNTHFTGEKEEKMPEIRQTLYDVIDIWGQKDTDFPVFYFKKK